MTLARLTLSLVLLASPCVAQDTAAVTWNREVISSAKLKEDRTIYVVLPANYATSTERYPVLVVLDASGGVFPVAVAHSRFLTTRGAAPRMIFVGIPSTANRTRDLTPTPTGRTLTDVAPNGGGADAFADFIFDEVLPFVGKKYRTQPATFLSGHSYGGLFALHVASTRPGKLKGIIAASPALWFNDSSVVVSFADALARSSVPLRMFLTSGGREPAFDVTTKRFVARLDSLRPGSVSYAYRHYPDDTHNMTPPVSVAEGVRFLFEPISQISAARPEIRAGDDSARVMAAVTGTEEWYARGARSLGLPETLPEQMMNQLAWSIVQQARIPRLAVWAFRRNVARYPESATAYHNLAEGLLLQGDTASAKVELKRGIDVATRLNDPRLPFSRRLLSQLEPATQAGRRSPP